MTKLFPWIDFSLKQYAYLMTNVKKTLSLNVSF